MVFNNDTPVNSLAISSIGNFFIAGSNDKVFRIYKQTKNQVFVALEEDTRQEKMLIEDYT